MTEAYETSCQTVIAGEYETSNEFCYCINYYYYINYNIGL